MAENNKEDDKKKKGFLRRAWGVVTSPWVSIPLALITSAVVGPLLFDMGTWLSVFHNPDNLRALALSQKLHPFTSWLPYHMGLTEPGGLFYDAMTAFLGSDLEVLMAQKDTADGIDSIRQGIQNSMDSEMSGSGSDFSLPSLEDLSSPKM